MKLGFKIPLIALTLLAFMGSAGWAQAGCPSSSAGRSGGIFQGGFLSRIVHAIFPNLGSRHSSSSAEFSQSSSSTSSTTTVTRTKISQAAPSESVSYMMAMAQAEPVYHYPPLPTAQSRAAPHERTQTVVFRSASSATNCPNGNCPYVR